VKEASSCIIKVILAAAMMLRLHWETAMKKRLIDQKRLRLSKETIRMLISGQLQDVAGGVADPNTSCGGPSACDCSTGPYDYFTYTKAQY
jgi:hypothetical protein